jgi:hypothetical protein
MIQMIVEDRRKLVNDFLNRWPLEVVRKMQLNQYNHLHSHDSFCYWLEHIANDVGSIKGLPQTVKFGIYHHDDSNRKRKKNLFDAEYAWLRSFGLTRDDAFREVRKEILQIINYATIGNFKAIDDLRYTSFGMWKIAFMYSNERLIPIFKWDVLKKIVESYGVMIDNTTKVSYAQEIIMSNKPPHQNVFEFTYELWFKFSGKHEPNQKTGREGTSHKNINPQNRIGSAPYTAQQKHNMIQNILFEKLKSEFGDKNVFMEKNFIDIKVIHNDGSITYYEVKANSYASGCIKEALGQIISYSHSDAERIGKYKLVIVGQYPPFDNEAKFINYTKNILKTDFEYDYIPLPNSISEG